MSKIVNWNSGSPSESESVSESPYLGKHSATSSSSRVGFLVFLPSDIIFNILSRLPVKSLLQCKCVCKTLHSIVDIPHFAYLHVTSHLAASAQQTELMGFYHSRQNVKTNKTFNLFFLKNDKTDTLSFTPFPIAEIANATSYNVDCFAFGFLCFKDSHCRRQVFLFNPLTGEILMLPPFTGPSDNRDIIENYGMGFDSTEGTFKVVRVFYHTFNHFCQGAEVYTLGTSSWRAISTVPPHCLIPRSVSAYGDVHWKAVFRAPNESFEGMIITFDTRKEEFKITPHPDFPSKNFLYFHLFDWKGSLAMADVSSPMYIDIWILKDYCKWAREYRIRIEMWLTEQKGKFGWRYWRPECVRVYGVWEDGVIFGFGTRDLFYYNTNTDCLRSMEVHHGTLCSVELFSYNMSLVSLKNYGDLIRREEAGHGNYFDLGTTSMVSTFKSLKI